MDVDWLNRAGILAEAVAFVLVAPEIIGHERLQRVQTALERWATRNLQYPTRLWHRGRLIPFLPAYSKDARDSWLVEIARWIGLATIGVFVGLSGRLGLTVAVIFWSAYAGSIFIGVSGAALVRWSGSISILRYVGYALAVFGIPALWLNVAATSSAFALLRMSLRIGNKLLSGEGRLRALVFGSGVVLLFGGMAAQFVATF